VRLLEKMMLGSPCWLCAGATTSAVACGRPIAASATTHINTLTSAMAGFIVTFLEIRVDVTRESPKDTTRRFSEPEFRKAL
jgi:hypothetical protein